MKNSNADMSRCAQRDTAKCGWHDVLEYRHVEVHTTARQQEEMFEMKKWLPRGSESVDGRAKLEADLDVQRFYTLYHNWFET